MIYFELFYVFFLVGLFTFGGGYAMISILEGEIVSRGWLDKSTFYNVVSISESTPGPIAVNMATFVGNMEGGILGSIVATIGIVLPSFIIILLIATILSKIIENHIVKAILDGFKAVVVGLIFATAFSFLYNNLFLSVEPISIDYIALIVFIALVLIGSIYKILKKKTISPYLILIISGLLGMILYSVVQ